MDLIYTILYSITEHTSGIMKNIDWRKYNKYDFECKNDTYIEFIVTHKKESNQPKKKKKEKVSFTRELWRSITPCMNKSVKDQDDRYARANN